MHYSPAGVWPVASNGCVFICDPDRATTAIDLNTGRQLWRTYQSKARESIGLSKDGKRLYLKTMMDSIVCYAATGKGPQELWATNCGFGYEHARVMLVEKDGVVFTTNKDGLIIALDGKSGRLLWKHKVGNTLINTVVPLSAHRLIFTNEAGLVGEITAKE
jgi:outer membrane protein assembly factor BamB